MTRLVVYFNFSYWNCVFVDRVDVLIIQRDILRATTLTFLPILFRVFQFDAAPFVFSVAFLVTGHSTCQRVQLGQVKLVKAILS